MTWFFGDRSGWLKNYMGVFQKLGEGYPKMDGLCIMEKPIKHGMIWGYHYFWKHPYVGIYLNLPVCLEDMTTW